MNRNLVPAVILGLTIAGALILSHLAAPVLLPRLVQAENVSAQVIAPTPLALADTGIRVSGEGYVQIKPDLATATVGVDITASTLSEATSQANTRMAAVVTQLKSMGIAERDIQTTHYNITPVTQTSKESGAPTLTGYRVQNQLGITVRKLEDIGKVVDAAVRAGANTVFGLSFGVADPKPYQEQARRAAVHEAQAKAAQLANASNIELGPVISISERTMFPQPLVRGLAAGSPIAPVEIGELTITVSVAVRYGIRW